MTIGTKCIKKVGEIVILINNQWEKVEDINDIYRILSELISEEFTDEVKYIFNDIESGIDELKDEIDKLGFENISLKNQLDDEQNACEELEEIVEKLKEALDDTAYETVLHQHPNCYDFSEYKKQYLKELAEIYHIPNEYMPK